MKFRLSGQKGFTITELTVVLPIITLITVALIGILFSQYGGILAESSRSNLRSTGQALLTNLQDEVLFTIQYGQGLDADLVDPHAPAGGWDYDTEPQTLIINETALDSTRRDVDRNVVSRRSFPCSSLSARNNPIAINNIIYFTEDNAETGFKNLIKRTITPTYDLCSIDSASGDFCEPGSVSTCKTNAKNTSCPVDFVGQDNCTVQDSILSENIIDFNIRYFETDNVETSFPSDAQKIEIELIMGDRVFGRDVEAEVNHTIRKIN